MNATSRPAAPVLSLLSILGGEAAHMGAAVLLGMACVLVYLSPAMAIFTLGSPQEAQTEAVLGSLIGLMAVVSTLAGILLVRVLTEEGTFDLLVGMGLSRKTVGFVLSGSLLLIAGWQSILLSLSAAAAMTPSRWLRAVSVFLVVLGLAMPRLLAWGKSRGPGSILRTAGFGFAATWVCVSIVTAAFGWSGTGLLVLPALMVTGAWGVLIGTAGGARLSVPLALTAGLAVWLLWTGAGPFIVGVLGFSISPLAGWDLLLGKGGPERPWLPAALAIASWGVTLFVIPGVFGELKGSGR